MKLIFHSLKYKEFRRYSQFRELRKKVSLNQIHLLINNSLPNFPKKAFIAKNKLPKERMHMLEQWLRTVMKHPECHELVLSFFSVPTQVVKQVCDNQFCKWNQREMAVASLVKNTKKVEKHGNRALKQFDKEFFKYDHCISQLPTNILLKTLVPLCGDPSVACFAIEILYKLLRIESYRFSDSIQQILFNNIELLREMSIEKHILNTFQYQTGVQGYEIAKMIKEYFDRNGTGQYFKYFLNLNEEAIELFGIKEEGKSCRNTICLKKISSD